ncbi:MAG: TonB-dependent receptor [Duncaniella sp.]|nr:TonB-dependent receptor [Duncaniella sp.]
MKNICFQMSRKAWLVTLMVVCFTFPALAQKITVSGTVSDPTGEPLIGASVVVQGETMGVATDFDGNYTISAPSDGVLVFSYVGYDTKEEAVNGRQTINVTMTENSVMLGEVVAIGYGAVKKSDATGSVAVIKPDEIEAGIATSTQDLLVGASPGVVVTTDGGNPTGGATIRIRGGSSLTASNDPLVVIDGVPQTNQGVSGTSLNALSMVNPQNIESMTILKDASATAIYGSRASNGVIIITTKKGMSGRPQVNFSANFSVNTARKRLNMMNAQEFSDVVRANLGESTIAQLGYNGEMYDTDWQDQVLRTSFSHDYNLSVGGKAGFLPYRVTANYTNNQGILKTSSMERTTVGFNLSPKFFDDHLSVIANAQGTYIRTGNADTGAIGGAVAFDPTKPVYSNIEMGGNTGLKLYNGYYNYTPGGINDRNSAINPVQLLNDVNSHNNTYSSTGNLQLDYSLHFLPELHFNLNLGYQVSKNDARSTTAANSLQAWRNTALIANDAAGAETLYKWYEVQRNTLLDFYANYKKEFEAIHSNLDVMVGYSWQRFSYFGNSQTFVNSNGFIDANGNNGFTYNDGSYFMDSNPHDAIGEPVNAINRWANPVQLVSFFGRLNYTFRDTYLLTFTLRDDGSSRFSKDNRWGLFPSVALGWKISNLPGLKDSTVLDEWKLRLGWGETGQQEINSYFPYLPIYTISSNNNFMYPSYLNPGSWINPLYPQPYDNNIKWETTTTWNVGFDLAFLNNRFTAALDWYLRDTRDLLARTPARGQQTSDYLTTNIGKLRNYGIEVNLGAKPVVTRNLIWSTGVNVAWNRNKITSLNQGVPMPAGGRGTVGGGIGTDLQWFMEGEAAYTYRVFQQVYDDNGDPIPGQYVDQNADGKIDDKDLINFHSPEPKVTVTWNNNVSFKNWDFGITLRANMGNWVYNGPRRARTNLSTVDQYGLNNLLKDEFLFSTSDGNLVLSDYWIENASFIRCDNITAGYTFENLLNNNLRLRIFGACQNPFVITKYKGIDPEVFDGRDDNVYPRPVTFTLGVIATF